MSMINRFWDALSKPEVAKANRDFLKSFYAAIKSSDRYLQFVFITGVSKFFESKPIFRLE